MSDGSKAVFLSYASQDAEAAKRICESLRAAGVEVWFDQNELVGGDAWDQKIRRQIRECALLIPIISAATQARTEGYFRLEWRLADQRTHLMAKGRPFLLPVVIDDTRDADAHVPDSFTEVQWTRLPGGETPAKFAERVKKLLGGGSEMEAGRPRPAERGEGTAPPRKNGPIRWWWALPIFGVTMALFLLLKESRKEPSPATPTPVRTAPEPQWSEARQLVEKAWQLSTASANSSPDGLRAAADLAEKATQLDPTDADVWATAGLIDASCWVNGADRTEKREEMARTKILRAKGLAPRSIRARVAEASMLTELDLYPDGFSKAKAEAILRELLPENLAGWQRTQVFGVLGLAISRQGRGPEAVKFLEQAGQTDAGWMNAASWTYLSIKMFPEALAAARRETEMDRHAGLLQQVLVQMVREDLDAALAALNQLPDAARTEELPASARVMIAFFQRDAAAMQAAGRAIPGDFVENQFLGMPKPAINGYADLFDGRLGAARVEFDTALAVVEQRLTVDRKSFSLLVWKIWLLHQLGRADEAEQTYRTLQQLRGGPGYDSESYDLASLGRKEEALARLEIELRQPLNLFGHLWARLDPVYDLLRGDPRFERLLRDTLPPGAKPFDEAKPAAVALVADSKSVAVLAFANLSDDKGNEYFSDGISEELLNVLAKIPGLKVTARTSSFHFKGKDTPIPEIAQQLGVAYVVEGSVRKSGDKVRITAQLIKAADGFRVWSDTFTRDLKDIFAVQDEIAGLIAGNLRSKMALGREHATVAPETYALILQGRHAAGRQTIDGAREAVGFYREAVGQSPDAADAWAEMAYSYQFLARFGGMATSEGMREARLAAHKALELDPEQPLGLAAFGWVQRTDDHDWRGAVQSFRHALAVAPESVTIMSDSAICFLNVGLVDESIALATRAAERDPLNPQAFWTLGIVRAFTGNMALAEAPYRRAIELAPAADEYHSHLARILTVLNRLEEAKTAALAEPSERYRLAALGGIYFRAGDSVAAEQDMSELIAKYGDSMAGYVAAVYAGAGRRDEAFKWLERAYENRDSAVAWVKTSDYLMGLHDDPRWPVFLRKMGLADDQLK